GSSGGGCTTTSPDGTSGGSARGGRFTTIWVTAHQFPWRPAGFVVHHPVSGGRGPPRDPTDPTTCRRTVGCRMFASAHVNPAGDLGHSMRSGRVRNAGPGRTAAAGAVRWPDGPPHGGRWGRRKTSQALHIAHIANTDAGPRTQDRGGTAGEHDGLDDGHRPGRTGTGHGSRSEERRVGKGGRSRGGRAERRKNRKSREETKA